MRKYILTLFAIFLPIAVLADEHTNSSSFYFGATAGYTKIDTGVTNVSGATLKESDTGGSLFIGKNINNNFSIEGFYIDFGEASLSGVSGNTFTLDNVNYQFTGTGTIFLAGKSAGLNVKLNTNINENFSAYTKAGIQSWEITAGATGGVSSITLDGVDPVLGIGIEYKLTNETAIILGADRYYIDNEYIDHFMTGLKVTF